jgi:hypothetical protein
MIPETRTKKLEWSLLTFGENMTSNERPGKKIGSNKSFDFHSNLNVPLNEE